MKYIYVFQYLLGTHPIGNNLLQYLIVRGPQHRTFDLIDRGAFARRFALTLREAGLHHYISQKYFMLALEAQLTDLLLGAGS